MKKKFIDLNKMFEKYGAHYLKLYIGCMFSSKSSNLIAEINRYKHITDNILVINHILDKDRHNGDQIRTHDNKIIPSIMLKNLFDIYEDELLETKFKEAEIVIIDEGQFFSDLYNFIKKELSNVNLRKKTFIIAGLSGDYNMNPIGDMIQLVPLADEIYKLTAYCIYCKDTTLASFTKKETNNNKQIEIGDKNIYSPVCRLHHIIN